MFNTITRLQIYLKQQVTQEVINILLIQTSSEALQNEYRQMQLCFVPLKPAETVTPTTTYLTLSILYGSMP